MEPTTIQVNFFQHIKAMLPPHLSFVDEIAELLHISNDSAYRRIRGEKPISFEELQVLCSHFKVSLDQFLHLRSNSILFNGHLVDNTTFTFYDYLKGVLEQLTLFNSFERREMIYLTKDIPFFHHCIFPELASFKFFFWRKSVLHDQQLARKAFSCADTTPEAADLITRIATAYMILPSQEIWNIECINSTLRQIDYYRNTYAFASESDLRRMLECLEQVVDHLEEEAELGYKFFPDDLKKVPRAPFKLFVNEFILGDNSMHVSMNGSAACFVNHSVMNYMGTRDPAFTAYTYNHMQNLMRKSTLISEVSEKERSRFFNITREKINSRKNALLH
ncbi:MAG TPA: helix-turn-helix transcriptional regulator [Flavitalea sp.]|nr:helix-turn-helix transcriptional regulator [Flavitalea sp.]